jgi:hypothetical protein
VSLILTTCHSKEWQLYMIALSQIQLGRFAEAKKSLHSVMRMSKEALLFDAHHRFGLLELLKGDVESADCRLAHLMRMQRSCQARGAGCEVHADLEAATSANSSSLRTAYASTIGLKPAQAMRFMSKGMLSGSIILARRGSSITFFMMRF